MGYFKVAPIVPVVVSSRDRALSFPSQKKLTVQPRDRWKIVTVPLAGLILALMFAGSLNFGSRLADYNLPRERLSAVTSLDLPANVVFLATVYETASNFFEIILSWIEKICNKLIVSGRSLLGQETPASFVVTTEQPSSSSSPANLFEGKLNSDKKVFAVMAIPASGTIEIDETLKDNLHQVFADPVDIKFDSTGRSGIVTPLLPDGRRGSSYVFVLTPAQ